MKKIILIVSILLLQYSGSAQEKIGIATDLPRTTLDVNGKLTVRDTGYMENSGHIKPLYVDDETGLIGTVPPEAPTAATSVLVANNDDILPSTITNAVEFNKGNVDINIPIDALDLTTNNLGLKVKNNRIEIQENGTYQINSYINIAMSTGTPKKSITVNFPEVVNGLPQKPTQEIVIPAPYTLIFLYARLRLVSTNGSSTISGTRPILNNILNGQSHVITLPSVTLQLKKGDQLFLAFNRTRQGTAPNLTPAGDDVTSIGLTNNYGAKPYSITITKL